MEKKILYINKKDADKVRGVHGIALLRKVKILKISEEEKDTLPEEAELLKFIGFSSQEVGNFLQDMKKLGIRVNLSLLELYRELEEEHAYMTQQRKPEEGKTE